MDETRRERMRGGGVHELREERGERRDEGPAIGGPRQGRFGRVRLRARGARGFGPLGRPADGARGEQGRLWGWLRAGLAWTLPGALAGDSVAGRGSAGLLRRFRDLGRYGLGGDPKGRRRYEEERGPGEKEREWE